MRSFIIKIDGHPASENQAERCMESSVNNGYIAQYFSGTTPKTLPAEEQKYNFEPIEPSRAYNFKKENIKKYYTKKSCFMNHVRLWNECVNSKEALIVLEHDALAKRKWDNPNFEEILILNINSAKTHNRNIGGFMNGYTYKDTGDTEVIELNYDFRYWKENLWKGGCLMPGTAAYAVTPKGAQRLLDSLFKNGWDQSDFFINSKNVYIEYASPEYFGFNGQNLRTSGGLL